jgi:hypothetical protein
VTVGNGENNIGDITLVDDPNPNPPGLPNTIVGTITVTGIGNVSGTNVILERNGVQIESTTTNNEGKYGFYVPVGTYTVRAIRNAFQEAVSAPFTLNDPSQPVTTNLTMQPL